MMGSSLILILGLVGLYLTDVSATQLTITGRSYGSVNQVISLVCTASNQDPAMNLKWTMDGKDLGGSPRTINGYGTARTTQNTLSLKILASYDQKEVICTGTQNTANGVVTATRSVRVRVTSCRQTRAQQYYCPYYKQVSYRTQSTSCRRRWWRRRCSTSYGRGYTSQRVNRYCYRSVSYCCSGWSGSSCTTYAYRPPTVSYCPTSQILRAAAGETTVKATWSKPRFSSSDGVTVQSTYGGESASLSFGSHTVKYTARNNKNGRESICEFSINVLPGLPQPEIKDYSNGDTIQRSVGDVLNLECVSEFGDPAMDLKWVIGGVELNGEFTTESAGYENYKNSKNSLQLTLASDHNNKALQCKGTYGGREYSVQVTISLQADSDPMVDYCPDDITKITSNAPLTVTWSTPTFLDPGNALLTVTNNLGSSTNVHDFPYGKHEIIYTATNADNGKTASCSFFVTVSAPPPEYPSPPVDGATVCGAWFSETLGFPHVCIHMCDETKGIYTNQQLNDLSLWTTTLGVWFTPLQPSLTCEDKIVGSDDKLNPDHRYTGECSPTSDDIKNTFRDIIQNSNFRIYCQQTNCSDATVTIKCG